jgi:hypothetical protein
LCFTDNISKYRFYSICSKNFYTTNSTLFDFNEISYVGRLWWPELISDIKKFLPVSIFKMAATIPQKFNIISNLDDIGQCWIFAVLWQPFRKWRPVDIFQCWESILDIIIYPHLKCRWNRTMLNLCGIVVAILKMTTGRNFSMSRINSGYHNLPTYEMSLKSDNVEFVRYCGGHFENGDR